MNDNLTPSDISLKINIEKINDFKLSEMEVANIYNAGHYLNYKNEKPLVPVISGQSEIKDTLARINSSDILPSDHISSLLKTIKDSMHHYNDFISIYEKICLQKAHKFDQKVKHGEKLKNLESIPYGVKDIFDLKNQITSCNSHLRKNFISTENSAVIEKLVNSGAILIGKLNTHELALGGPSHELPFPPSIHPHAADLFTGGSSSGSAVAVARKIIPFSIGSDTTGSVRTPSSYCNVIGFKPSFGLISRHGSFPLSHSLDHVGIIANHVEDINIVLNSLAAYNHKDISSIQFKKKQRQYYQNIKEVKIGVIENFYNGKNIKISKKIKEEFINFIKKLEKKQFKVYNTHAEDLDIFDACGRIIMAAESYDIHKDQIEKNKEIFGRYSFQRIFPGRDVSASSYIRALKLRNYLSVSIQTILEEFDFIIAPTNLTEPPNLKSFGLDWDPPSMQTTNVPFTVSGNPAITLPYRKDDNYLFGGIQIVGRIGDDFNLINFVKHIEKFLYERD